MFVGKGAFVIGLRQISSFFSLKVLPGTIHPVNMHRHKEAMYRSVLFKNVSGT